MSQSRSRSLPRERSTRRRRSPSRSRSRSRSPADRRRRSRSRSRSPSIETNDERHKKHKKRAKEKKRHKKHKHKKDKEKEIEAEGVATISEEVATEIVKEQSTKSAPVDAKSFFEQLQKREAAKEPVGTVHARGLPAPVSATAISTSDKWECSKARCGHMNSKHAPACNKCGAMKRMTEWR